MGHHAGRPVHIEKRCLSQGGFTDEEFKRILAAKGRRTFREFLLGLEAGGTGVEGGFGYTSYRSVRGWHRVDARFSKAEFAHLWKRKGVMRNWHEYILSLAEKEV